ncbi:ribbon-helix-helix domain-containing protein [Rhizobium sp. PL01]|jgi:predicted DNA-binding ribbon-helix-helix protein|uniref:ribbon-helix-helix domain-containing protein n=1 Tax=Rhizobium sp. PL01 TaxID=3085631 RepID=UPI002980C214|nr:ribbon-helix-helix domain-containing protein [Rhizobium sp. PL01]MDW5318246.1 ribbon-helix-helix domain-containing protein [Rhizobium sp. PL01]
MALEDAGPVREVAPPMLETRSVLPRIAAEEVEPHFKAVGGRTGERRGIRLERIYWDGLSHIAAGSGVNTADLVEWAASQIPDSNLASLLRAITFKWALCRIELLEAKASMANLNAIVQASPAPTLVLTRERKIFLFNDPFLAMLRSRLALSDRSQLKKGLRFLIDIQIDDALRTLNANEGTIIKTGFSIGLNLQTMRGKINIAPAPTHEDSMLIGYVSGF